MLKKLFFLVLLFTFCGNVSGQSRDSSDEFYVNLFISAGKNIYVETTKTEFSNIQKEVSELIRNRPFQLDQNTVFRIFADENLELGYIIDVNQEMFAATDEKVKTERYLLNTETLNIDGQNWFEEIDLKGLKADNQP
ncbi:MAG: hypothetical protein R3218_02635 [Christiangramia sp.]|nr:hypothetical protein [Christiangramia sp.]